MSSEALARPEPEEIDETRSMELRHLSTAAGPRGRPSGEQQCSDCRYYLENTADVSYCWHPKLRILVGDTWWCQWWVYLLTPIAGGALAAAATRLAPQPPAIVQKEN